MLRSLSLLACVQQRLRRSSRFNPLQQFIARLDQNLLINTGHDTLGATAAAHFGQPQAVGIDQPNAGFASPVDELAHPDVAAQVVETTSETDFGEVLRHTPTAWETEQDFGGGGHAGIINVDPCVGVP